MRNKTNELTFSDAVRIYQADRRDRDFGYMYPVEEMFINTWHRS